MFGDVFEILILQDTGESRHRFERLEVSGIFQIRIDPIRVEPLTDANQGWATEATGHFAFLAG